MLEQTASRMFVLDCIILGSLDIITLATRIKYSLSKEWPHMAKSISLTQNRMTSSSM